MTRRQRAFSFRKTGERRKQTQAHPERRQKINRVSSPSTKEFPREEMKGEEFTKMIRRAINKNDRQKHLGLDQVFGWDAGEGTTLEARARAQGSSRMVSVPLLLRLRTRGIGLPVGSKGCAIVKMQC